MNTPKRMKLCRPLPPELLSEMHKCLPLKEQIELIGNVPSRVIVLNNSPRVRRTLQHFRETINSKSMPEPPNQPKGWHLSINPVHRILLAERLAAKALNPTEKQANFSSRIKGLISWAYAQKMEKQCFEVEPNKAAYYYTMVSKIYKIQKETEEREQQQRMC